MAEYISKDKFIHFLFKEIAYFEETQTDIEIPISATLQSVVNEIKKFTSEDVQPVKWIPVTERLPNSSDEYVLCCGSKGGMFVGWAAIKTYDGSGKCTGFQNSGKGRSFTHWMPLPEPPKGECNG